MTRALAASRCRQFSHYGLKQDRRDGQVMRRPRGAIEFPAKRLKGGLFGVIAVHIVEEPAQLFEHRAVQSAVLLQAVRGAGAQLLDLPARFGHTDHGHVEVAPLYHRLQRREDLLVRQIAARAEEHQGIGLRFAHGSLRQAYRLPADFSRWPPKP